MNFQKQLTINIGGYESLRIGVEGAPTYNACDAVIIAELLRIKIPVSSKIKQCIHWNKSSADIK